MFSETNAAKNFVIMHATSHVKATVQSIFADMYSSLVRMTPFSSVRRQHMSFVMASSSNKAAQPKNISLTAALVCLGNSGLFATFLMIASVSISAMTSGSPSTDRQEMSERLIPVRADHDWELDSFSKTEEATFLARWYTRDLASGTLKEDTGCFRVKSNRGLPTSPDPLHDKVLIAVVVELA